MFKSKTDIEWEKFGKDDPYFGVITHDKYRKSNLTEENKEEFFQSGSSYIHGVLETIRQHIDPNFKIKKALDFGCGVGRLVIPLAKFAEEVTGVDVSDSMLEEAKKNCEIRSIRNVAFVKSDNDLKFLKGKKYDFIHSFIVFQHIPVKRGERIYENLLAHLEPGGACVVHFTYANDIKKKNYISYVKKFIPLSSNFINLLKGRKFFAPQMQMNDYNLNHLFLLIQKAKALNCYIEFTDHGGFLGVVVYFQKSQTA